VEALVEGEETIHNMQGRCDDPGCALQIRSLLLLSTGTVTDHGNINRVFSLAGPRANRERYTHRNRLVV